MEWKIYYGDGGTFSSDDGPPDAAPALNVQCIAQADEQVGRHLLSRHDYYWLEDGAWHGGDIFGLFDYLMRAGPVKFGRSIGNERFQEIVNRATLDPDLPPKSAWRKDEHR